MPNLKSAKKKLRQDIQRTKRNDSYRNTIKKSIKSLQKKKGNEAVVMLKKVFSVIDKAAKRKVIHKNKAARLKSRAHLIVQKNK